MTGKKDFLRNLNSNFPYTIGLHNVAEDIALHEGIAYLSPKLTLFNVLYLPYLRCNLIYEAQLAWDNHCFIYLFDELFYTGPYLDNAN